jgi:hypothetical protein
MIYTVTSTKEEKKQDNRNLGGATGDDDPSTRQFDRKLADIGTL